MEGRRQGKKNRKTVGRAGGRTKRSRQDKETEDETNRSLKTLRQEDRGKRTACCEHVHTWKDTGLLNKNKIISSQIHSPVVVSPCSGRFPWEYPV